MDWSTVALLFPGQGSQQVGMGAAIAAQYPAARAVLDEADALLGFPFSQIMAEGPAETLDDTLNTQPALYIAGVATFRALESIHGPIVPLAVAGHSLGEFTALTVAGALSFPQGVKLVRERARLMQQAGKQAPGAMAALLGIELDAAHEICAQASAQAGRPVVVANDNCPGQIVISGDPTALDLALPLAKERGAKRALKLAVSVAAHSPLMASAAAEFQQALAEVTLHAPKFPVIGNLNAAPLETPAAILNELTAQLTGSVRWADSIRTLRARGATQFYELGSKDALTGMLKRIDKEAVGSAIFTPEAVAALGS